MQIQKQIGKIILSPISLDPLQYVLIPAKVLTIIDNTKWNLSDGRYHSYNFSSIVPYLTALSCLHLDLSRNNQFFLLKSIQNIQFKDMRELSLNANNIESLEILGRIFMPNLENLMLNLNNIVSLRPFAHIAANCQNLQWISLQNNPIPYDQFEKLPIYLTNVLQNFKYLQITYQSTNKLKLNMVYFRQTYQKKSKTNTKLNEETMKWTAKVSPEFIIFAQGDTIQPYSKKTDSFIQ